MDEEEVKVMVSSVTPDAVRRNSTGKVNTKISPFRLGSDEKPLVPHYLRSSTNSCHEFCKYGRKHVFEPKKRHPNRIARISEVPKQKQVEVLTPKQKRKKRPELKVNFYQSEDTEQKDIKEIQVSGTITVVEKGSFEASESPNLPTPSDFQGDIASPENSPSSDDEEYSGEPVSVRTEEESSEASGTTNIESFSPVEKRITSVEPTTLVTWSEGSAGGSAEIMELELPLPIHTPMNEVEGSSVTPSLSMETINKSLKSNPATPPSINKSSKANSILPPSRKITAPLKARPSPREEGNSSMKLKSPSPIRKSLAAAEGQSRTKNLMATEGKKRVVTEMKDTAAEEQSRTKNLMATEGKKRVVTEMKDGPQLKTELSDRAKVIRDTRIETITKKKTPSTIEKKTIVTDKPKISMQKSKSSLKKVIPSVSPKVTKQKTSIPSVSLKPTTPVLKSTPTRLPSERLTAQRNMGNKMLRSINLSKREGLVLKPSKVSVSSKPTVDNEISSLKLRKYRSLKPPSPVKSSAAKVGKPENTDEKVKEKTLYVIEPKPVKTNPRHVKKEFKKKKAYSSSESSSSSPSSSVSTLSEASESVLDSKGTERRKPVNSPKKRIQRRTPTTKSEEKLPSPHKLKFRRGKIVNPESENNAPKKMKFRQPKSPSEKNTKEVGRRILRRRRVSFGSTAEMISPSLKAPAVVSRHQDVQEKKETPTTKSEGKLPSPHKLKFRRGKIVNPESENNAPKKLKFRQPKGPSEKNTKEVGRRILRRRRVSIGSTAEMISPSLKAPVVVLRHQDVQEKKETQGLFNDVIEETASKLVEMRKSKVKALVGAFETVISLQESRVTPVL